MGNKEKEMERAFTDSYLMAMSREFCEFSEKQKGHEERQNSSCWVGSMKDMERIASENPNSRAAAILGIHPKQAGNAEDLGRLNRVRDWDLFAAQVREHIIDYTLKQYHNPDGDDQATAFTADECVHQHIKRYVNRFGKCVRGPKEELRDLLKIAHYASFAYEKRAKELDVDVLYPDPEEK
jgi:hypothetical protein